MKQPTKQEERDAAYSKYLEATAHNQKAYLKRAKEFVSKQELRRMVAQLQSEVRAWSKDYEDQVIRNIKLQTQARLAYICAVLMGVVAIAGLLCL